MNVKPIYNQKCTIWSWWNNVQMCCCQYTIQLKCTSSYPVMNSLICTCIQLQQPRRWMHFFSQAMLIHHVMIRITIIQSKINQNRKKLTTNFAFHVNNGCLVICMLLVHSCMNLRNVMTNIPNYLCLLTTLLQWKILLVMIFSTYPALEWSPTITYVFLSSNCEPCPF